MRRTSFIMAAWMVLAAALSPAGAVEPASPPPPAAVKAKAKAVVPAVARKPAARKPPAQLAPAGRPAAAPASALQSPAPAPAGRIAVPVPVPAPRAAPSLGASDVPQTEVVRLALNKARPLDLPTDVRDVVVGNPDIADVLLRSARQVYVLAKGVGDTNVFLLDSKGQVIRRLDVNVAIDVETLRATLHDLLPNERLTVSAVNDTVILSGVARSDSAIADARNVARRFVATDAAIVNMARVGGEQQVLLRVRVAEVQKTALKELGFRLSNGQFHMGEFLFSWSSGVLPTDAFGIGTAAARSGGIPGVFSGTTPATSFGALERHGLVRTLAEPNLTAVSGETATMLAGGEFPIPISAENNRITVDYRSFGVGLSFLPVVLSSQRISLKLSTEVSAISDAISVTTGGLRIPGLTVRRAATTVEMPSGGTIMIAGLMQNEINDSLDGIPALKDLPVLGPLFRSTQFRNNETELVVTVSAYTVQPSDARTLALPTDGFAAASDLDRYLLGRLHRVYRAQDLPQDTQDSLMQGPVGYIVQ